MRLLHTETLALTSYQNTHVTPLYTILSHTWSDGEEVSFQEMQKPTPDVEAKPGYQKIKRSASIAQDLGFKYIWVDTCCINKDSSAELSEAINSMYRYYQDAQMCFAYLSDVPSDVDPYPERSAFRTSKWFTRGWTLQELLAPRNVVFYAKDWKMIGTKSSLQGAIADVTGIPSTVLVFVDKSEISVAQRLSWVAKRNTSREEDMAYCLMGLFNINMPILYGEGSNAFTRLQHEIMRTSDDESLFAWQDSAAGERLVAHRPYAFIPSATVQRHEYIKGKPPFTMTKLGVHIQLPLIPQPSMQNTFLAILNCRSKGIDCPLGVYLRKEDDGHYVRVQPERVIFARGVTVPDKLHEIYVRNSDADTGEFEVHWSRRMFGYPGRVNGLLMMRNEGFALREIYRSEESSNTKPQADDTISFHLKADKDQEPFIATSFMHEKTEEAFVMVLGLYDYQIWADIVLNPGSQTLKEICDSYVTVEPTGRYNDRKACRKACLDLISRTLKDGRLAKIEVVKRKLPPELIKRQ